VVIDDELCRWQPASVWVGPNGKYPRNTIRVL
jgi:hypothetical protein